MNLSHTAKQGFSVAFYGVAIVGIYLISRFSSPFLLEWLQPATVGAGAVTIFAALYVGELKQESVGQLYQALAAASLKTAEMVYFHEAVLGRVRAIRKILLVSNIVKLCGSIAGIYLINEKVSASPGVLVPVPTMAHGAVVTLMVSIGLSLLIFARLWCEVNNAENALISAKEDALLKQRKKEFLGESQASSAHDFNSDDASRSFRKRSEKVKASALV